MDGKATPCDIEEEILTVYLNVYCRCMTYSTFGLDKEWYDGEFDVVPYREVMKLKREHDKTCDRARKEPEP